MTYETNNLTVQLIRTIEKYKFNKDGELEIEINRRVPFGDLYEAMDSLSAVV